MRKRGAGLTVLAVVVVVVVVNDVIAIPTAPTNHQPAEANHVEDHYLDDALGNWLDNFGTYTFMVKQDLDTTHAGDADEDGDEEAVGGATDDLAGLEDGEQEEEEEEEEWSAPIAVSTGSKSLLNPHHDYLVTVESLVAEEGSIFLTLSRYDNQTTCGVGGLSLEEEGGQEHRKGAGDSLDIAQGGDGNDHHTTLIAFGLQQEGNATPQDTSKWMGVSGQYFWASGQLDGGGMLSISFTPPECGCLALSTYFALPVGNLTLVVGPQAYPDELQNLLCVDPLGAAPQDHEYDEEEEEEVVDYIQQPSALVASRNPGETETEGEERPEEQPTVTPRKRKMSREEKKRAKKARRQMKRQRIRQAGRRQARRQGAAARRNGRRLNRKKNQRKRTKAWKKLHKRGRKGRRRNHANGHHHHHHNNNNNGEVNGTDVDNMTHPYHHHHHHHHAASNVSSGSQHEERLVDILLRNLPLENSTGENETDEESGMTEEGDEATTHGDAEGEEQQTPKQRRKNRRQHKKKLRKQKRKTYPPGVKFCCKQGVKHKKNILEFDSSSGNSPGSCNTSSSVVSTFANHQFGIEVDACTTTFTTCCHTFTEEMWEGIKAKKAARRTERKQRRKSRRQDRKQRRREERRLRKEMKRQSHGLHDEPEECTGDEGTCVHQQ